MSRLPAQNTSSLFFTERTELRRPTEYCFTRKSGNEYEYVGKFLRNTTDESGKVVSHVFSLREVPYNATLGSFRIVPCNGYNRLPDARGHAPDPLLVARMNRVAEATSGLRIAPPVLPRLRRVEPSRRLVATAEEAAAELGGEFHQLEPYLPHAVLGGRVGGGRRVRRATRNLRRKTAKKSRRSRSRYSRRK